MKVLRNIAGQLVGLFLDDPLLAGGIVAIVAAGAALAQIGVLAPEATGPALLIALLALLGASVWRAPRAK